MRAISQSAFGGPEVLELIETDRPEPGPDQVLVRVRAAGVNPVDWKIRSGTPPLFGDPPYTLGFDVSGVVEAVGSRVTRFRPGDEIYGMPAPPAAAYAEYLAAAAADLARKPPRLDHVHAGALPAVALTAWQALVGVANLSAGQRVLIHAAAGGIGHLAVQIAKTRGAYVVGTARKDRHDFLYDLGIDEAVDYTVDDFAVAVRDMDVVLDLIGGAYGRRSLDTLRPGGLLVTAIWTDPGVTEAEAEQWGLRYAAVHVAPSADDLEKINELIGEGRLSVYVDQVLGLEDARKAHELSESGHVKGKIVLVP
ncbi:NADP-dependent oxidoreductase [Actinoplanes aureus]|uniref:NADP-dependent oxidoreductase n=1 Tax=Actinoplanes aureus TaxID=2792083 RepID=A0A931C332_9ACTN|nr:NADP-dependent oxidoreductase [Actinoplanes aureus]MBG0561334.1 NADP-dependent oxidoreductase [Actinoplanes aureus]